MICSWDRRCRADSGSGNMSRRLPISQLMRSRRCFDAPFVDLTGVEDEGENVLDSSSHILGVLEEDEEFAVDEVNFSMSKLVMPLSTCTCPARPILKWNVVLPVSFCAMLNAWSWWFRLSVNTWARVQSSSASFTCSGCFFGNKTKHCTCSFAFVVWELCPAQSHKDVSSIPQSVSVCYPLFTWLSVQVLWPIVVAVRPLSQYQPPAVKAKRLGLVKRNKMFSYSFVLSWLLVSPGKTFSTVRALLSQRPERCDVSF